ncbi:glycerate kinase [Guptibacillus hwajinpoensis]|uniref:glycerate kinase n=1 Tax=Guptibacillus hwajinpoensis TaxID=208199 RepID=UPI00273D20A9|nr:glycerate kinase [Pseudalkalibacillus hwajinpoensis]WLR58845.1 glycerate kinase [Pseudalkalibacillus hwajinpoensis]
MKFILAPDSFKGSLSALEVSKRMERGIKRVFPTSEIESFPLADGGEGTVDSLITITNGTFFSEEVYGPLGEKVIAKWGILGDGKTAVIEMAEASGITLLSEAELDPLRTSTFGTGELIKIALDHGCSKIILGIGGSATNDGGAGMATALGVKFLDETGTPLPPGGQALQHLDKIDTANLDQRVLFTEFTVACDVTNPLCGPEGASAIFSPQKGATPEMVKELDDSLANFGHKVETYLNKSIISEKGAGAAGGLGGGLIAFLDAKLKPGIDLILDLIQFEEELKNADLVLVGEGKTDNQTAYGKAPMGVGIRAKQHGVPVFCISGSLSEGYRALEEHINAFFSIANSPATLKELSDNASQLLEETVKNVMEVYKSSK